MVFYFSNFLPASRFAWMMLLLLAIAVIGDLVLLPALVVGPAGRLFERQYRKTPPKDEASSRLPPPHQRRAGNHLARSIVLRMMAFISVKISARPWI